MYGGRERVMVRLSKSGKVKGFKVGNNLGKTNKGRKCTWRKRISETLKRKYENPEFKETHGFQEGHDFLGDLSKTNFFQNGVIPWNKGLTKEIDERVEQYAKKTSEIIRTMWKNDEYREKTVRATVKALLKRPTSLEKWFIQIIEKHSLSFRYVGDGSFLIGFKNPDFINTNGLKICVEVAYEYFKIRDYGSREQYEIKRAEYFARWGWATLFFWGEESEEEVIKEIKKCGIHTRDLR